jgi:enamine deaminase RidA (YjgF/YER057c/UK114 family)
MKRFVTGGRDVPRWTSPISHAVVVDDICYLSGQLSLSEDGEYIPGTAREEAGRSFENLFAVLRAAGFAVEDLAFVDVAFADLADVVEVNALYMELFPEDRRPARTICQAAALPYGGRVKVAGVAIRERKA